MPRRGATERLELDRYRYLHATQAELLRRLDRVEEAGAAYERALELVHSDAERRFLELPHTRCPNPDHRLTTPVRAAGRRKFSVSEHSVQYVQRYA
jgi:hypothetical protein